MGGPLVARADTVSGTVVDLATYVTHDHNMDAMHGSMSGAMHGAMPEKTGGAMHEDSMAKHPCPATLGLVTHGGAGLYLLVTQMGSKTAQTLCGKLDKTVSIGGTSYEKGGMHALLVSSVH
ncbi:MAG: hypothetical protein M3169_07570 [Candidatus Eremiobacteraeota bacterium]|nr:hypothetical protein [Candidatus Eremiobacteraeota bacterium]